MIPTDKQHEEAMQRRWSNQSEAAVAGSLQRAGSASDVRLTKDGDVWHVSIDGEHATECCDWSLRYAMKRAADRILTPNDQAQRPRK